jgi:predicted nuclease of restriction endonuclease-like (RecB) superfamily
LAERLTVEFGKGFSETSLKLMRIFYLQNQNRISQTLSDQFNLQAKFSTASKRQTVSDLFGIAPVPTGNSRMSNKLKKLMGESGSTLTRYFTLSWSHYVLLLGIKNADERSFYEIEANQQNWTVRELKRQFDSGLYERLALSRDKAGIRRLALEGQIVSHSRDLLKEPLVLEFLGLDERTRYSDSDLESAIISQTEQFLLEMGKAFFSRHGRSVSHLTKSTSSWTWFSTTVCCDATCCSI